ncbi:MAG: flagellar hook assembly protein FlgD [Halioglobus sp.]
MDATPSISELFPTAPANGSIGRAPEDLGQEDFLELMVAQLENQDPTKPMDNFEFLSQIAQFGTVEGIQNIEQGFTDLTNVLYANQSLQAASLVGNKVVTESNLGQLPTEGTLDATINLPANTSQVQVYVQDMTGRLVHTQNLGAASSGELNYKWNGVTDSGATAPAGQYRVSAEAVVGGQVQAMSVHTHSLVESVTIDQANAGVQLNLAGGNSISLGEVKSFL